jgi:hypothetical protein
MVACTAPDIGGTPYLSGPRKPSSDGNARGDDDTPTQAGGDGDDRDGGADIPEPGPNPPPAPPPADGDNDGAPDTDDCDPLSPALGARLLEDDLTTDKGLFTAVDGFPQASWSYDGTAYRQGRLLDASDATVFVKDPAIGDVFVEVRAASTEISSNITPRLRQMFILLGTKVIGGELSAIGCGVEVVQGGTVEQKTSVVRLAGPPGSVTTTPLARVDRAPLQVNEEFSMRARLVRGTLTCEVTQGAMATTTTATASGIGTVTGSVGLFTRQTKALFKKARICRAK